MYCKNCKKQSPDNFANCVYCGAPLTQSKKMQLPHLKRKCGKLRLPGNTKSRVISLIIIAVLISVVSVALGTVNGAKPEKVIRRDVKATQNQDKELYFSLFDDCYKSYQKEYVYYDDERLFDGMTETLSERRVFYAEKCGEPFTLKLEIQDVTYLDAESLARLNESLREEYSYTLEVKDAAYADYSVTAKGEKNAYESVYRDCLLVKIGGKWYKAPENLSVNSISQ